jgi:hypothetical protein
VGQMLEAIRHEGTKHEMYLFIAFHLRIWSNL